MDPFYPIFFPQSRKLRQHVNRQTAKMMMASTVAEAAVQVANRKAGWSRGSGSGGLARPVLDMQGANISDVYLSVNVASNC